MTLGSVSLTCSAGSQLPCADLLYGKTYVARKLMRLASRNKWQETDWHQQALAELRNRPSPVEA